MEIPVALLLYTAAALSSIFLLLRGDEEWHLPLAGAALVLLAPLVVYFVFQLAAPHVQPPVYIYGFYDVEKVVKESAERIEEAFNAAFTAARGFAYAVEAASIVMSAALAVIIIAIAAAPFTAGATLALAAKAFKAYEIADHIWHAAVSGYNVATGMAMTYHVLGWLAKIAATWAIPLFFIGMTLMLLPRVRALGGVLFGLGLFLYVATISGAYITGEGIPLAQWLNATAKWANSAPKPNYTLWSALFADGGGLAMLRVENRLDVRQVEEAIEELQRATRPINATLNISETRRFLQRHSQNGVFYAVGGQWVLLPAGNKTWRGLDDEEPYAVYAWLDVPRSVERLEWCVQYDQLIDIARQMVGNIAIGNATADEWMRRVSEAECKFYNRVMPWHKIYTGPQSFWRLLTADVNITVVYGNATLLNETRPGAVGVWGWIAAPDSENYRGGNMTIRRGLLVYDPGWNSTHYVKPAAGGTASNFTLWLVQAPSPTLGDVKTFYKWKETCEWCCGWTCDDLGNCWCSQWCSATRDVWEEPRWSKTTYDSAASVPTLRYLRPWVPENQTTHAVVVDYIYRDWRVWHELQYGPWHGDGTPPSYASCWTHGNSTYKRVKLWDVGSVSRYVYGFAWLHAVELSVDDKRIALPDYYDEAPDVDSDGVPVVNLLRGAEHDQYCSVDVETLPPPRWGLVPRAVSNLTYINREAFFYLLAAGNYSRAYLEGVVRRFTPAQRPEPFGSLYEQLFHYYYNLVREKPYFPLPDPTPRNYTPYNFYVACIRFDWRSEKDAVGRLTLWPGNSTWLMQYPLGDSPTARQFIATLAERWRWFFNHPPPPPPVQLATSWQIPWNNWTALPYAPARAPPPPPPDPRWGVSFWDAGLALLNPFTWGELWGRLFTALFISAFAAAVVLEVLAVVLGFPSIGQFLVALAVHVVQDIAFWFNIRLFIKAKWVEYAAKILKAPASRAAARVARRFAYRWQRRRVRDRAREVAEKSAGVHPEAVNAQLRRRVEQAVLERLRTAREALGEVRKALGEAAREAWEVAREAYRVAREVKYITDGDVVHFAREVLRRVAPRVEARFNEFFDQLLMHPVGRWLYYTVLWRMDDRAVWRAYLNPAALREMYLRGRITREEFEQLLALREYLLARRAYLRARALREAVDEEAVARKARELEREMLRRSKEAYLALVRELAFLNWAEVERRAAELENKGLGRDEALRTAVREAVERVEARVRAVYEPLLEVHMGAFSRLAQILGEYLGREFNTPRELAEALVGVRVEEGIVEDEARARFLAHAHRIWAVWEEHWFTKPLPYDAGKYALATALDEIAAKLPTLRAVAVARAVALGAVKPEEAEKALGLRLRHVEPSLGVEERAGRYTPLNEGRPALYIAKTSLAESLALLRAEAELESAMREEVFRAALSPLAAEEWAYRLLEKAIRAAREGDEKARREVLEKSFEYFREFGLSFAWLPEVRRVYAVELPEAREAVKAFEAALRKALGGDREGAVRQLREELSRLKEFYSQRGGVSAVKTIERLEGEFVKALERAEPGLADRAVGRLGEAAERAVLLRRVLEALGGRGAEEALKIVAEGREAEARASLLLRRAVDAAREQASLAKSLREEAAAVEERFRQVYNRYASLAQLLERYLSGDDAALEAIRAYSAQVAEEARKLREEALGLRAEGYFYTREFLVRLAEALPELERLKAAPGEERLRAAGRIGQELREALARGVVRAEVWLPDPLLYAIAVKYKELVEEYRAARAAGDAQRVRAVEERLEALRRLVSERGADFGAVLRAVFEGWEPHVRIHVELPDVESAVRAWELAVRAAAFEKGLKAPELEPLGKYERSLAGYRGELERAASLVREAEEAWRRGDVGRASSLLKEARAAVARLNKAERGVNAPLTKLEAPADISEYEAAWALVRLEALAPILFTEAERQALARVLQELKPKAEYAERLRREFSAYFTPVKVADREVEVPLFKQPTAPLGVFSRALAVVLLGELAARDRQVAEYVGKRVEAIFHSYYTEALSRGATPEEARRAWAQALREAREALRPPLARLRPGDADAHLLREAAEAVLEAAGRLGVRTEAVKAALQIRERAEAVVKYFHLLEELRQNPTREGAEELRRLYEEAPLAISYLLKAKSKAGEEAAALVRKFAEELSTARPGAVEELKALVGGGAGHLLKLASISREAAVAVEALAAVRELLPKKAFRDVQSLREAVREAVKALEAYPALVDFLRSPTLGADLARLRRAARGDKGIVEFIEAVAAVKVAYETEGKVRLFNKLYEELLPYLGWEREKMLLRAPPEVYVLNRMGARLAREVYTRYPFFEMYGEVLRDAAVLADIPLGVGMPVKVKAREYLLIGFPEETYQDRVAKYVRRWSWAGVAEGIRRYYRGEGRAHRELAMLLAMSARVIALEKAAEALEGKAPRAVVLAVRARAAWEEARLYSLANKLTKYNFATEASKQYGELLRELRAMLSHPEAVGELARFYGPLKLPRDPEEAAYRLVKWTTPERVLKWVLEMGLGEAAGALAKAVEAFRTYRRMEKWLGERRAAPAGGVEALSVAKALEAPAKYTPSRVEEAVVRNIRRWAEEAYKKLAREVLETAPRLPRDLPAPMAQWLAERGWRPAVERGDREALRGVKEAVRRLAGEFKAVAQFSQGARSEVLAVLREWYEVGGLRRYAALIALQEVAGVEPARAPDARLYNALPPGLRKAVEGELRRVERALVGEGYYDEVLKPVYKALGLQPARRSPAEVAEAIAKRIERAEAPAELKARALEALRGLASTGLDDPALYERAVRAGDAVLEVLAYAAGKRLEDAALLKRYDGEELLKAAEGAVRILGGLKPRESLPLDVAYRLVGRDSERALPKYLEALGRGRVPEPEGAALVFYTTDEEVAARLARRFPFIRAAGASLVGRGAEAREYFFFYHPALEPAVNMLKATGAGVPHDRPKELAHLGFAPAEFAFAMAGVRAVDVGGVIAWREGKWNEFLNHLKSAVVPEWPSNFGEKVREVLGKKSFYDLHLLFYIHVEGYREFLRLRELDRYDENALVAYLAALAAPAYIHWVLGQAGERSEAFELLRKCDAEACLYALSDMSGIDLYRALARARGAPLGREAGDAIGATLEWVKFILGERMAPPARKSPYLELAAWLVATARGEPYEKVLAKAVEELKRTSLPPGFKIEDEEWWVKKAEEPGRERPGGEARPAGEAGGGKTAGKAAEERRVGRAGGEALRGEETKLRGEQREVRGERPGSKGEEAAQAKPASEAAGVVKQTAGAGPEGGVGAAGFIPPGLSGLSAAGWLAGVEGRVELSREAAWALRERVRKAVEKAKARHMPRLYRLGGGALVELAEEAAGRVLDVVFNAVDSPGALRRIAVLLEGVEEVLFEGRGSGDAEALFGWVRGYLERAGDSAWEVWQFVYSTARAAVDAALAFYDDVYKGIATVETALKTAAVAAAGLAGFAALHDALHATAVFSATATAIALAGEGAYEKAVEYVKRAAEAAYEAAREIFEKAKIALERLYELFLEAVARALDYVRAHWLILAATAAGLVSWMAAQQLDFSLWQDHVARFAPLIAGVPAFKEFKTALDSKAPELLDAAEEALRRMSEDAVDRLFEKAREAVGQSSRLWADFRKAVRSVEARGRGVKPEHAAVAWALLEAGLKELGGVVKNAAEAHRRAVEGLVRGEEVELPAGDIAAFVEKTRDVAHRLGLLFERIAEKAEKYGSAEAVERAFTVTELAGKLAEASTADLGKLGEATLADKVVAFFESLAEGATWSRVVLNALERGEAYGALIRTPRGASDKYGAGSGGEYAEGGRLGALVSRLAHWLAELGIGKATARRVGDNVEISADGKTIAEVGAKAVRREEGGEESVVFRVKGELAGEVGKKAAEMAERMEPGGAERYQVYALLATDGGYKAEGEVYANTTSVLQAALYRRLGMEVSYAGEGNLTKDGFKPVLTAKLSKERGGREVVEAVRRDLEDGLKKLWSDEGLREELRGRVLKLLSEVKISTRGAGGEEGLQAEEVRARLRERIEKFLTELRLGEGGAVCLVNCQFGEQTLTYSDEPHARVVAPLLHYIAQDAPVEEVGRFMAYALLFDGHVRRDQVYLVLGNFHVKEEEGEGSTRRLPLDVYDKVALYIVLAAKYGVGISRIYLWKDAVRLHFDGDYAARIFASAWHELSPLWKFGVGNGLYADHVYKKLGRIKDYVEAYADRIKIAYELYSQPSGKPGVRVMFKDEKGNEIAHINIWWDGKALYAKFSGARERAERLASILNALGAEAEVRKYGGMWYVLLTTDSITAIRRGEWLNAVRTLVEELYRRGVIDGEKREKLLREINAGPNVVEVAGVELSVNLKEAGKYKWLDILYQPRSAESFNATVKALKDAGFEEGVHFTTRKPEGSERGHIRLKLPAGLWRLEELRRQGVGWAEKALRRLEEIGRARGFSDLLEEYLRPAREAETVDPRGITTEVKDGVKAVVRDVKVEWEDQRPRITVEYEAGGDVKSLSLLWGVGERGRVRAGVWLDVEKAAVLATLTGDESIRGKRGKASLSAHHLLALARLRGVGWDLLRWYAEVMRE